MKEKKQILSLNITLKVIAIIARLCPNKGYADAPPPLSFDPHLNISLTLKVTAMIANTAKQIYSCTIETQLSKNIPNRKQSKMISCCS